MIFLIAAVPSILAQAGLGTAGRVVFDMVRWPVPAIVIVLGLGVLYHLAVGPTNKHDSAWSRPAR
jgi:hypothetical protein